MGRACSKNGKKRNVYRLLLGNPEGNVLLRRPKRTWVDKMKIYWVDGA
jgi:hypothetical protein